MIRRRRIRALIEQLRTVASVSYANKTKLKTVEIGLFKELLNNTLPGFTHSRILDEATALVDELTMMIGFRPSDNLMLDEAIEFVLDRYLANTASILDEMTVTFTTAASDSSAISDSTKRTITKIFTEVVEAQEYFSTDKDYQILQEAGIQEQLSFLFGTGIADTATIEELVQTTLVKTIAETITASDSINPINATGIADVPAVGDVLTGEFTKGLLDQSNIIDSIAGEWTKHIQDSATATDDLDNVATPSDEVALTFTKTRQEIASVSDVFSYIMGGTYVWGDSGFVSELLGIVLAKIFTESSTVQDVFVYQLYIIRALTDNTDISDTCTKIINKGLSDNVGVSEGFIKSIAGGDQFIDGSISIVEMLALETFKGITDSTDVTDLFFKDYSKPLTDSASLTDMSYRTVTKVIADLASAGDSWDGSLAVSIAEYATAINALNPLAYWRLGESTGTTATDETGNYNGTYVGTPTLSTTGLLVDDADTAVNFDGTTDYVSLGSPAGLQITGDITVSCIVKLDRLVSTVFASCAAAGETEDTNYLYSFYLNADGYITSFHESGAGINDSHLGTRKVSTGIHHITFVRDTTAKTVSCYIDGSLSELFNYTSNPTGGELCEAFLGTSVTFANYLDGILDEVALFNTALTASDVTGLSNISKIGKEIPETYVEHVLIHAPVAYWRLGESSGTTAVDEINNYNGTYVNTPTLGVTGLVSGDINTAVDFDGIDDHITVSTPVALQITGDMSISAIVNFDTLASNMRLICCGDGGEAEENNYIYSVVIRSDGGIEWFHENGAGTNNYVYLTGVSLSINTDYHLVIVRDDTAKTITAYVNGVLADSASYTNSATGGSTAAVFIGKSYTDTLYFDGIIDEMFISNKVLTATEVSALYTSSIGFLEETVDNTSTATDVIEGTFTKIVSDVPTVTDNFSLVPAKGVIETPTIVESIQLQTLSNIAFWSMDTGGVNTIDDELSNYTLTNPSDIVQTITGQVNNAAVFPNDVNHYLEVADTQIVRNTHAVSGWVYPYATTPGAVEFTGSNEISIPDQAVYSINTTGSLAVSCLFNAASLAGTQGIVFKGENTKQEWGIVINGGRLEVWVLTAAHAVIRSEFATISADTTYHCVVNFTGYTSTDEIEIWLDGVKVNTVDVIAALTYSNTTSALYVGSAPGTVQNYFTGVVDEVAVFPRVLTSGEIASIYATATS